MSNGKEKAPQIHVENIRILEVRKILTEMIHSRQHHIPVLEVVVTEHVDQYEIPMKIDSVRETRDSILDGYEQEC